MSAVNRDTKTPASLLALARTRRMQRALAHASMLRGEPLPTLRSSLGYMTSTARVADEGGALGHRMTVLGVSRLDGVAYVVEEISQDDAPIVYRLYLCGPRQGHLVPVRSWYEHSESVREIRARIAALSPTLEPVHPTTPEAWMLSTRIVQRRALRLAGPGACAGLPIRKFALQLVVEPVGAQGPSGRSTVTAFLQPHAHLTGVWSLSPIAGTAGTGAPCQVALARVTFTGIPSGTGLTKDTVVLLTAGLWGLDLPDLPAGSAC
ncbi:MAG TPA: hypothetical protein VFT22_40860 [Kofleriaceae bacterium]|nr:hypothetical protein [Kofleriaceae bacterium]